MECLGQVLDNGMWNPLVLQHIRRSQHTRKLKDADIKPHATRHWIKNSFAACETMSVFNATRYIVLYLTTKCVYLLFGFLLHILIPVLCTIAVYVILLFQ